MFQILEKKTLAPGIVSFVVEARRIAEKARAGQFVVLRLDETGERIPLTIADADRVRGSVRLVVQDVGYTTHQMCRMEEGDYILDLAGPLGRASEIERYGTIVCIGGGVGVAPVFPIARALSQVDGNRIIGIIGAKSWEMVIMLREMEAVCERIIICTDDGSMGRAGFVTDGLKDLLEEGLKPDLIVAIGPLPMMKAVSEMTREHKIPTRVSLNPIMVDGTGMCGACRVPVGGKPRFACVHGPEFDGHEVDWDTALIRARMFEKEEELAMMAAGLERGECRCQEK